MIAVAAPVSGSVESLNALLYTALAETFGYSWTHSDDERDLRRAIRDSYHELVSEFRAFPAPDYRTDEEAAAYALGYLPRNYVKAQRILCESRWDVPGGADINVLDLGVGPGTISLAAIDLLGSCLPNDEATAQRTITLTLVDYSAPMLRLAVQAADARKAQLELDPDGSFLLGDVRDIRRDFRAGATFDCLSSGPKYDLIAFGNCLSEVCDPGFPPSVWAAQVASLVSSYAGLLTDRGQLLVLEPSMADVRPGLKEARDILVNQRALRCITWLEFERLPDAPIALTPALSLEILGDGILRAVAGGSPYTALVLERNCGG